MTKNYVEYYFEIRFLVNNVEVQYLKIINTDSPKMAEDFTSRFEEAVKQSGGEIVKVEKEIINPLNKKRLRQKERGWRRIVDACIISNPNEFIAVEEIVKDNEDHSLPVYSYTLPVYLRDNVEERKDFNFKIQIITSLPSGELESKNFLST